MHGRSVLIMLPLVATSVAAQNLTTAYAQATLTIDIEALLKCPQVVVPTDPATTRVVDFISASQLKIDPTTHRIIAPSPSDLQTAYTGIRCPSAAQPSFETLTYREKYAFAESSGLPSEATIITGLTDFIVARAKDELAYAFLEDLQKQLKNPMLGKLFPKTYVALNQLQAVSVSSIVPTLRAAATIDLDGLPLVMFDPNTYPGVDFGPDAPLLQGANQAMRAYMAIRRGTSAPTALSQWATLTQAEMCDEEARLLLRTIGNLAAEYVTSDAQVLTLANGAHVRYFLAYFANEVVATEPSVLGAGGTARVAWFINNASVVTGLIGTIKKLEGTVQSLQSQVGKQPTTTAEGRANDIDALASALGLLVQQLDDKSSSTTITDITTYIGETSDIVQAVLAKDYPRAIVSWVDILRTVFDTNTTALRVLSFAASLAAAKTSADVETVIASVADPVGSYRAKRGKQPAGQPAVAWYLNAYLGGTLGGEYGVGTTPHHWASEAGLTAPVGLEMNVPINWYVSYFSVLASVIDVGNVANYRINSPQAQPKVGFSQVLGPGVFLLFGLTRKAPITFGGGAQYVPELRKTSTGQTFDVFRLSALMAVDVPILRL